MYFGIPQLDFKHNDLLTDILNRAAVYDYAGYVLPKFSQLADYSANELLARRHSELLPPKCRETFFSFPQFLCVCVP